MLYVIHGALKNAQIISFFFLIWWFHSSSRWLMHLTRWALNKPYTWLETSFVFFFFLVFSRARPMEKSWTSQSSKLAVAVNNMGGPTKHKFSCSSSFSCSVFVNMSTLSRWVDPPELDVAAYWMIKAGGNYV